MTSGNVDFMKNTNKIWKGVLLSLLPMLFTAIGLIGQVPANDTAEVKLFRAGASTSNITPPLGLGIVGNFGNPPPAQHIHDELHARSLVLDDGTTQLLFVVVDNLMVGREVLDEAKKRIHERTGLPTSHMLISAIHTHSATSSQGESIEDRRGWNVGKPFNSYQQFLISRIADGAQVAFNNLEPAHIGWGAGNVPQHVFNRRWIMKKPTVNPFGELDKARMNPGIGNPDLLEPAGPTDPEVSFISVKSVKGKHIALLANYSLHYVGGVPKNDISADYFAVFADRIQELLGADRQDPPFVGILSNGTSGDINNINFRGPAEKRAPYEKMHVVANDVAQEVFRVCKTIDYQKWVSLRAAQTELTLNVREVSPALLATSRNILARPDTAKPLYHPLERAYATHLLQMKEEWPEKIAIILQVFRVGDLHIAAIPFEVFAETGLEIKAKSQFESTFTIELANGAYGYLPTPEQHALGGYETWLGSNKVEENATRKIVAKILLLFSQLN